jgi:beta-N-acetylhexosaminidase|tara:strand:- start:266 stop:1213 length:948 start_codon:yes stop_codon:yes gene_type:complete
MKRKAIIISLKSYKISKNEIKLLANGKPWGIILFRRNIKSFNQIKILVKTIKKITKDKKFPIMIDEEGGRVSRLKKFINNKQFSQKYFGDLYEQSSFVGSSIYKTYINSLSKILFNIGININTVPILDLSQKKTHKIIGNRAYSNKIKSIRNLSKICIDTFKKNKISTVIKHIPGHGSATVDSHMKMPIVNKSHKFLHLNDFECFKSSSSHFAMTAHVLFKKIDDKNVATFSKKIISSIIRKKLKFKGILISDDISMKALKFNLVTNAKKSLDAGCNLILYCGGKYSESAKLLKELPYIDRFTQKKTSEFYNFLS